MTRDRTMNRLSTRPRLIAPARGRRAFFARYGLVTAIVFVAVIIRLLLQPIMPDDAPIIVPLIAVMASAAFGGLGPAVWAMALGGVGASIRFHLSGSGGSPFDMSYSAELQLFLLESAMIACFGAWLHAVRRRAEAADLANAALEKQMLDIGDQERRRFGHDLHDGLGQQLTGIALLSETLAHRLQAQNSASFEQADQISKLVSETVGWTRELARGLSPLTLESDGLLAAVEELASRSSRLFQMDCRVECELETLPIDEDRAIHVYRIIQEAISNSAKHGKAKNVTIRFTSIPGAQSSNILSTNETPTATSGVSVTVFDDGSGLSAKTVAKPGIGLRIMQYRANLIGATLSVVRRSAEGGTIVSCVLPGNRQDILPDSTNI